MPLTGEAKREWQRTYDKERRSIGREVKRQVVALVEGGAPGHVVSRAILDGAREKLQTVLTDQGLIPTLVVAKVREKLEATRPYMLSVEGEKGKRVAIEGADNDAQLRACDLAIRLQERAGTIPTAAQPAGGAGGLHYHLHLGELAQPERLIPAIDAAPDADQRVIDAQVLDSSDDA